MHRNASPIAALWMLLFTFIATAMAAQQEAQKEAPKPFKEEELAALLAPIALYPDTVITQILMASTYPLEVVQANRWLQQNKNLTGEALASAANEQPWDESVQSLVAIPDVLKMMDEKLDWTQKIGDAFLAQQKEVLEMVQTLRRKAQEAGNLKSDGKMKVTTEAAPSETAAAAPQVIVIESQDPQVVYVPTYSPLTIYGSWGYPAYPPYYYPPPVGYPGSGFWYGAAIGIGIGYWGGHYDHCYPDWHGGQINIGEINIGSGNIGSGNIGQARPKATTTSAGGSRAWQHNPEHRQGVSYRDSASQSKYGGGSGASATRDAYRGRGSSPGMSAGTRDLGSGASARNAGSGLGSGSRAGASTRDIGGSSRGSSNFSGSRGSAFGGMSSGASARNFGSRGGMSRGGGGRRR